MNRNLLYISTIILTLAGCASEDYIGDPETRIQNENGKAISLNLTAAPQTRSAKTGAEAASDLNNNFVIWGDKTITVSDNTTKQTVFDNYQVNYVTNSANTTTSNSAGWEYVGYTSKKNVGQTIKFWDYSADHYDFFAYSLGKGDKPNDLENTSYATATEMNGDGYKLSGTVEELAACYISDKVTKPHAELSAANTQVSLKFRRLGAKVKIALYETIPGYSVKDVKFYRDGSILSGAAEGYGTTAYLYAANYAETTRTILSHTDGTGTISVEYGSETPTLGWTPTDSEKDKPYISFGDSDPTATDWANWAEKDYKQAEGNYIGRSSVTATGTKDFMLVLPSPSVVTPTDLKLKIDYTLLTRDGLGETIHVTGATATVPAAYAQWKPNYSYTYLFKISDNTNGLTNPNVATKIGLSPITLDAVVCAGADGEQETVTTVTDPSITTYQKGSDFATTDTYNAGDIYVVVTTSAGVATLTTTDDDTNNINAKLYAVTNEKGSSTSDTPARQITETSVANVLTKEPVSGSYAVTDANGWTMTVTPVAANVLSAITQIDANDAPDGKAITINGAKFTAVAGTTYVFEYIHTTTDETPVTTKYYKVIKVASGS